MSKESLVQYQPPVEVYNNESMAGSRPKKEQVYDSRLAIDGKHYLNQNCCNQCSLLWPLINKENHIKEQ